MGVGGHCTVSGETGPPGILPEVQWEALKETVGKNASPYPRGNMGTEMVD